MCGLAPSTGVLIAARLVQGLAGAMMIPQGLGILREVFPPEEIPKAFGLFGPVMGSAAMIGPILGGGLIALNLFGSGWRLVFLINLPLGLLALAGAARLLPRGRRPARATRSTSAGLCSAALAALAIVYPLIQGRELGWPAWTYASMAVGVVLFAVLRRAPAPPPAGRSRPRWSSRASSPTAATRPGRCVMLLYFGGMVGSMLAITLFLQLGEGFSAIHAGLTLAPFALGTAITAPLAGQRMATGAVAAADPGRRRSSRWPATAAWR